MPEKGPQSGVESKVSREWLGSPQEKQGKVREDRPTGVGGGAASLHSHTGPVLAVGTLWGSRGRKERIDALGLL